MTESALPRSPDLMSPADTGLLVVDVQGKLISLVDGHARIVWNLRRLLDAAEVLGVTVAATEQYPKGLGPTTAGLAARLDRIEEKVAFSCGACGRIFSDWQAQGIGKVLVAGIETHVCVQQTALDLLADGWRVYVAADAVGSRYTVDREYALRRMESCGAILTTTEAAIFEWCGTSARPEFKQLSKLIQEPPPADN